MSEKKTFSVKIDVQIMATSIDDAFRKIGQYYTDLATTGNATPIFIKGKAEIGPVAGEQP